MLDEIQGDEHGEDTAGEHEQPMPSAKRFELLESTVRRHNSRFIETHDRISRLEETIRQSAKMLERSAKRLDELTNHAVAMQERVQKLESEKSRGFTIKVE